VGRGGFFPHIHKEGKRRIAILMGDEVGGKKKNKPAKTVPVRRFGGMEGGNSKKSYSTTSKRGKEEMMQDQPYEQLIPATIERKKGTGQGFPASGILGKREKKKPEGERSA